MDIRELTTEARRRGGNWGRVGRLARRCRGEWGAGGHACLRCGLCFAAKVKPVQQPREPTKAWSIGETRSGDGPSNASGSVDPQTNRTTVYGPERTVVSEGKLRGPTYAD